MPLLLLLAGAACSTTTDRPYEDSMDRQSHSIFRRTARPTPAEQFTYAESLQEKGRLKAAAKQYHALVRRWPDAPQAARAQHAYARLLDERGKYLDAFDEYEKLIREYSGFFPYKEVLERQYEIALWLKDRRKGKFLLFPGFYAPERAIPLLEKIVQNGPEWERAAEAQYMIGQIYDQNKQYELAAVAYTTVQYRYPHSAFAQRAAFAKAVDLYRLAQESPYDQELAQSAQAALDYYIMTYSDPDTLPTAKRYRQTLEQRQAKTAYDQAVFYDKLAHKPRAALMAYKRFLQQYPHSGWTTLAEMRIQELKSRVEQKDDNQNE
jgi:outer membrane protein assembly factor BamD (BamD/ComL family)